MIPTTADHLAILDLLARYCAHLDQDDVESWVALFTPDGSFEVYGRSFKGHEGLRKMIKAAPGGLHLGGVPVVEMTAEDTATTVHNLLFIDSANGESRSAVYNDDLVRTTDGWKIRKRKCRFITAEGLSDRPA